MRPRPRIAACLVLGLLAALAAGCGRAGPEEGLRREALDRALRWSLARRDWNLGSLWMLTHVCRYEAAGGCQDEAARRVEAFLALPGMRVFQPLFGEHVEGELPPFPEKPQRFVAWMLTAVHCDRLPVRPRWLERMRSARTQGYAATHQLVSLELLRQRGCLADEDEAVLRRVALGLAAEQEGAGFSDLYAERAAFLYFAGFGDLVEPAWIGTLLAAQDPAGSWHDPATPEYAEPNLHTTMLAAWAVAGSLAE